jgi:phosphoglycerol transferase MdoB-like AlkP superfamily enzyme
MRRLLGRWFRRGGRGHWPLRRRIATAAVLAGLCVLACRGGLQRQSLPRGSAYFGANQLVGQLAMNDFYTMFYAAKSRLTDGRDEDKAYHLPPVAEAAGATGAMLFLPDDEALGHAANPLWRRSHSPHPRRDYNVVVVLMESMSSSPVGALGYSPSHTPQLDALCQEGLYFERMYAVGARTSRAMVGVLCGHPDLGGTTVMKRPRALGRFLSLPEILRQRGYRTMFIYGGMPQFDNMGPFLAADGVDEIIGQNQMDARPGNWGVPDEAIFRRAHQRFEELGDQPFFAAILTVSNHDPFEVPAGRVELLPTNGRDRNRELNACRYADWALGDFLRYARHARYFAHTLFVLVADHGHNLDQTRMLDVPGFRIPCLIYAPGIVAPGRIATVASQTDIPPTVLGLLGGAYEHCFLGRDVLRVPEGDGFALLHEDVNLAFVRDGLVLSLSPGARPPGRLFHVGPFDMRRVPPGHDDAKRLEAMRQEMLSYYTMARHLYAAGAYCSADRYAQATTQPRPDRDADR